MICWAFSVLSQKLGWPICSVSLSRCLRLLSRSKGVPEQGQMVHDFIGTATQIDVHGELLSMFSHSPLASADHAARASQGRAAKQYNHPLTDNTNQDRVHSITRII